VVALRIELSATCSSDRSGQPALGYRQSGRWDSNPRSRAPNDHAAHGARRAAAALHPVVVSSQNGRI